MSTHDILLTGRHSYHKALTGLDPKCLSDKAETMVFSFRELSQQQETFDIDRAAGGSDTQIASDDHGGPLKH